MKNSLRLVVLVLLALCIASNSYAAKFETRGYRQCMTLDQVQAVAERNNQSLTALLDDANFTINQDGTTIGNLYLLKGRLDFVHWEFSGGVEGMVKQLSYLTKDGFERIGFNWRSNLLYDGNEMFDISAWLARPNSRNDFYVGVTLTTTSGSESASGTVAWRSQSHRCK